MRPPIHQIDHRVWIISLASAVLLLGCGPMNHGPGVRGYCDDTGCWECDDNDTCWTIPNRSCKADKECDPGERCTSIGCARPCKEDGDCDGDQLCTDGYCAPPGFKDVTPFQPPRQCKQDTQCEAGQVCDGGVCKARCKSDDDCSPGNGCTACGKCQPKTLPATCGTQPRYCSADVPCGVGKTCLAGRCHFFCESKHACPVGQLCAADGICKSVSDPGDDRQCTIDVDCKFGVCINGFCHSSCSTNSQCSSGSLCQMGVCQPDFNPSR